MPVFGLLLAGCSPSAPSPPLVFYPQGSPSEDHCEPAALRIDHVDEPTALGFSAIDVLAQVAGPRYSPLIWLEQPANGEYELSYGPEHGVSSIGLDVRVAEGQIWHQYRAPLLDAPEGTECDPGFLQIPVELSIESAAQALNERVSAVLEARVPYRGHVVTTFGSAALAGGLRIDRLGSLDPARSFWLGPLTFEAWLWRDGSSGSLSTQVGAAYVKESKQLRPPPLPAAQPGDLALWPSARACDDASSIPLPSDAKLMGWSARDVMDELGAKQPRELTWSDGSVTGLELDFAELPSEVCQSFEESLEFDAALRVKTSDGRIHVRMPVRVSAAPERGGIGEIALRRGGPETPLDAADLAASGITDAPVGDYASILIDIEGTYRGAGETGSISLRGVDSQRPDESGFYASTALVTGRWAR